MAAYNVLTLGASYGSLLATKLLVRRPQDHDGVPAQRGRGVQYRGRPHPHADPRPQGADRARTRANCRAASGRRASPTSTRPIIDLVALAMQEPQYRSPGVRELLDAVARAKVPCMSIMNMPPLPYLKRIPGLNTDAAEAGLYRCQRLGQFRARAPDPVQPRPAGDPAAGREDQRAAGHPADQLQGGPLRFRRRQPRSCGRWRRMSTRPATTRATARSSCRSSCGCTSRYSCRSPNGRCC